MMAAVMPGAVSVRARILAPPPVVHFHARSKVQQSACLPLRRSAKQAARVKIPDASSQNFPVAKLCRSWHARTQPAARAVSEEAAQSVAEEGTEQEEISLPQEPQSDSAPSFAEALQKYKDAVVGGDEAAISEAQQHLEAFEKDKQYFAQQVASLTEEVSLSKDRFLRLNADFDNFRKRSEREKVSLTTRATGDVIGSLLPIIDNFERAKTSIKAESDAEKKIDNSYQGIYKQFVETMKSLGVTAVETVGKEFDPNLHDGIMREESTAVREGFVIEEFRKGFQIGEKLLRPAMVKVSAGPGPADEAPVTEEAAPLEVPAEEQAPSEN